MKYFLSIIIIFFLLNTSSRATTIVMGSVNTIYGNEGFLTSIYAPQTAINTFGVGGMNPGFATGYYYYTITRSGSFTTSNLQFGIDNTYWVFGQSHLMLINNATHYFSISGIIPSGTECGVNERIIMKIYAFTTSQLVQSTTFIIINPLNPIPVTNFKILGSAAIFPTIIYGCGLKSPNILSLNLPLKYTGTGVVWKYRITLREANSSGNPITGGFTFIQSWINLPVPISIVLNTLLMGTGVVSGQVPSYWAYYLVSLETQGLPCGGGTSIHTALIHLAPEPCSR